MSKAFYSIYENKKTVTNGFKTHQTLTRVQAYEQQTILPNTKRFRRLQYDKCLCLSEEMGEEISKSLEDV